MKPLEHKAVFFIAHPDTSLMIEPRQCMFDHDEKDSQSRTMSVIHGLGKNGGTIEWH
jgi:hypothetical protein